MPSYLCMIAAAVVCLSTAAEARAQESVSGAKPASACPISTDAEFGRLLAKPIRVGGGAAYAGARERRYLDGLRGPAGEVLTYTRTGSTMPGVNQGRPVDVYTVTYAGLDKPFTLYLDAYHFEEATAPAGLVCAQNQLGPPPIDFVTAGNLAVRLAVEQGADSDFAPISLDVDGSARHGVAFDRFRLMARDARAAKSAGAPIDPQKLPARFAQRGMVIVAVPLKCGDREIAPQSIEIVSAQGQPPPRTGDIASGDAIAQLLPGYTAPTGAIAAQFPLGSFRPIDSVRITYAGNVCTGAATTETLPMRVTGNRGVNMPMPSAPAGSTDPIAPLWFQVIVDHEGRLQLPEYLGGPEALRDVGLATMKEWRAEPARVNGAPVISDSIILLKFKQ